MKFLPIMMFWLLGVIWGSNFIYMKMASGLITPVQVVLLRVLFGLIPVALYACYTRAFRLDHAKHFLHFLVMAFVATIAYYYGFVKGASLLLSGVSGALSGLTPILSFLLALMLLKEEKIQFHKIIGIAVGFGGVLLIARPFGAELADTNLEGVLYNIGGSFAVGASFVYAKKYVIPLNVPFSALITYQLVLSLAVLLMFVDLEGIGHIWTDAHVATGLVLGLGILGTGLAYIFYYYIIEELGAVTASSVAYIPPVVAIAIGVVLVGEEMQTWDYLGTVCILGGVLLINRRGAAK